MLSKRSVLEIAKSMNGVAVMATLPGSPAYQAGLRYGDVVLEVNGQPTASWADYLAAKDLRNDGMRVVFLRAGAVVEVELIFRASKADPMALVAELASQRLFGPANDDDDHLFDASASRRRVAS